MLRLLITLFSISLTSLCVTAQEKIDTVYLKNDKETVKDSADEYRIRNWGKKLKAEDYSITYGYILRASYYTSFDPYIKEGHSIYYLKGVIYSEGEYVADKKEGIWKTYYSTGELWYTEEYKTDLKDGSVQGYFKTGEIKRIEQYKDGKFEKGKCYTRSGRDTVFYAMNTMTAFPGGQQAMMKYFQKNLKYPKQAKDDKIEGKVYVQFTIFEDGSVQNVVIRKSDTVPLLNETAIEFVKQMPKWEPASVDGTPVKMKMVVPILFKL